MQGESELDRLKALEEQWNGNVEQGNTLLDVIGIGVPATGIINNGGMYDVGLITESKVSFVPMIGVDCGFFDISVPFKDNVASLSEILKGVVASEKASLEVRNAAENLINLIG